MNVLEFKRKKQAQQKLTVLTCYDYTSACLIADSKIDCVLVGDSVAMVMHGYKTTINATLDMMEFHTSAVARGLKGQFLITDLPFLSHKLSKEKVIENVRRLFQAGAQAIKIEGADKDNCELINFLTNTGIPVIGHIGLTPQFYHKLGGFKVQGKTEESSSILKDEAERLQDAGCSAIVLECIPATLAQAITINLNIPTIGIGAGPHTDGQVLVWHDLLGLTDELPKLAKNYAKAKNLFLQSINSYVEDVKSQAFPHDIHCYI